MRDFVITTDITCDLPQDYIAEHNLTILPIFYSFNGEIYGDKLNMSLKEFYNRMREGATPTTMAINPDTARRILSDVLKEGYDIIHVSFSSALSSSCSVTQVVAAELNEENPNSKITIVDSLCASMGEGLLVYKAVKMKEEGKSYDEIVEWLENNKLSMCHIFTVDDLHYLQRGGRVSRAAAIIGTLINVKPILHVNKEGRLVPMYNVRGRKKSLANIVDIMEKKIAGHLEENDIVFISHSDCPEEAAALEALIRERIGITNILTNYICPTIGAHCGPGTIALFFMGNER
jgi:DegV family protein with EDD domain